MVAPLAVGRRTSASISDDVYHRSRRIHDSADSSDATSDESESSSLTPGPVAVAATLISDGSPFGTGAIESTFTARRRSTSPRLRHHGNRSVDSDSSSSHTGFQRFYIQEGDNDTRTSEGSRLANHLPDGRDGADRRDTTSDEGESTSPTLGLVAIARTLVSDRSSFGMGTTEFPFTARRRSTSPRLRHHGSPFGTGTTESPFTTRRRSTSPRLRHHGKRYVDSDNSSCSSHTAFQRFSIREGGDDIRTSQGPRLADHLPDGRVGSNSSAESLRAAFGLASILDGAAHADSSYMKLVTSCGGTAVRPFQPHKEVEGLVVTNPPLLLEYQHILFQPEYSDWSTEELRLADYLLGRCNGNRDGIGLDKVGMAIGSLGGPFFDDSGVTTTGLDSTRDAGGRLGPSATSCDDAASDANCCPGTSIAPFRAAIDDDPIFPDQKNAFQNILFQDVYRDWSTEELRLADYESAQQQGTVVGPNVASPGLGLEGRFVPDAGREANGFAVGRRAGATDSKQFLTGRSRIRWIGSARA